MSSVTLDKMLIPFESDNKNPLFPLGWGSIDNRIVNVLVKETLSKDPRESKVAKIALFNLSQINPRALECLGNPFFKGQLSLLHPLLADFEFTLFSSSLPNAYKVLCDVFPTMSTYRDGSRMEAYDRGEIDYASGGDEATPKSSFKFKRSFLETGCSTQNEYKGPRSQYEALLLRCKHAELQKKGILGSEDEVQLSYEEYNSLLFHELGRAKLQEDILGNVPLLNECYKLATERRMRNLVGKTPIERMAAGIKPKITQRQIKPILELIDSCHWVVRQELVYQLARDNYFDEKGFGHDYCFGDDEDENEWMANFIPEHLEKLQKAISETIARITNLGPCDSMLYSVRSASSEICFDTI